MPEKKGYIYIMASIKRVLYIGVTSDLIRRVYEHKNSFVDGFSSKYKTFNLVYYEVSDNILSAIEREKQLKKWSRIKKENLINQNNSSWKDLYDEIV